MRAALLTHRKLLIALIASVALHALGLIPDYEPQIKAPAAPLRGVLQNKGSANTSAPTGETSPLVLPDDASPGVRQPEERTYPQAPSSPPDSETPPPVEAAAQNTAQAPLLEASGSSVDASAKRQYHYDLSAASARFYTYPEAARQARQEGRVTIRIIHDTQGARIGVELVGSSGSAALDQAAMEMLYAAAAHTPLPPALQGRDFSIDLGVDYKLSNTQ